MLLLHKIFMQHVATWVPLLTIITRAMPTWFRLYDLLDYSRLIIYIHSISKNILDFGLQSLKLRIHPAMACDSQSCIVTEKNDKGKA